MNEARVGRTVGVCNARRVCEQSGVGDGGVNCVGKGNEPSVGEKAEGKESSRTECRRMGSSVHFA